MGKDARAVLLKSVEQIILDHARARGVEICKEDGSITKVRSSPLSSDFYKMYHDLRRRSGNET